MGTDNISYRERNKHINGIMKLNFERVEVFFDIAHTICKVVDIRRDFADMLYKLGSGIEAHALALKIYNSHGAVEYDDRECALIREMSRQCTPAYIDAINLMLEEEKRGQ